MVLDILTTALARYFMEYQFGNKHLSHRKLDFGILMERVGHLPKFLVYINGFLEPEILCKLKQRWGFVRSLLPHSPSNTNLKRTIPSMKGMSAELPLIGSRVFLTTQRTVFCSSHCAGSLTNFCAYPKHKYRRALSYQIHSSFTA